MKKFLGDLEEKVMNVIWQSNKPIKPSEVVCALDNEYAYTTIMTVMSRLSEKNILKRKKNGKAYYYYPSKEKEKYIKPKLRGIFKSMIESYGEIAVSQFIDVLESMDKEELDNLKKHLKGDK